MAASKEEAGSESDADEAPSKPTSSSVETSGESSTENIESSETLELQVKNATESEEAGDVAAIEPQRNSLALEQQQEKAQPPPSAQWEMQSTASNYDNQGGVWHDGRAQQHQQYQNYDQGLTSQQQQQQYAAEQYAAERYAAEQQQQQYDANLYYLQEELSESLARESSLISQLDNLTTTALAMEQREELHKHQLDVLTERVVDVESKSADDRNMLIEYEANCTALGGTIVGLKEDLEEWKERCNEWSQKHDDDQEKLSELRQAIKEKVSEAEDLAIAMEELRMTEKRREQSNTKANAKSGGLFSWMLGLIGFGNSSTKNNRYDEEVRADAFEMAKSTLLRALQSERTNVHELESAVASLQQNNSAISEMVESRDNIIDELNNRIAVFEEDKVVLKAALRQLQKEMKEEEPKTQKLIDDLAEAEQEIDRIKADFHSIIETHQEELVNLQTAMSQKQKTITDAESNLTAIGTYVDKLEERLTSFAMTRRDMEDREKKCKEIEKRAEESEIERKAIAEEADALKKQEDELKKLLEELAGERATLQKENRRLYTEQEFRIGEQEKLTSEYEALQTEAASMRKEVEELKAKSDYLVPDLEASKNRQLDLERQLEDLTGIQQQLNKLLIENADVLKNNEKLHEQIAAATLEKDQMESKIKQLTKEIEERKEAERMAKELADKAEAERAAKEEEAKKRLPPPPPPSRPIQRSQRPNDVPLRSLRKTLSKATGLHGVLTPSSSSTIENQNTRFTRRLPDAKPVQENNILEDGDDMKQPSLPTKVSFQEEHQN